jgi:hypothetical protein
MCRISAALLIALLGADATFAAAKVEGTCYNLPPDLVPITGMSITTGLPENITFAVRTVRDDNPLLAGGALTIKNAKFDPETGKYSFEVDLPDPAKLVAVFIQFSRDGFPTEELNRIVLAEGVTNHVDLVVPREGEMVRPSFEPPCYPMRYRRCIRRR